MAVTEFSAKDVLAGLHRLEEGQSRIEATLLRIQSGIKSQVESPSDAWPVPPAMQEPAADSCPRPCVEDHASSGDEQEAVLNRKDNGKLVRSSTAFMHEEYNKLLHQQARAQEALLNARNQSRGWLQDKLEEETKVSHGTSMTTEADGDSSRPSFRALKQWLSRQMDSGRFDMFFGAIIFLNASLLVARLEARGQFFGYKFKFRHDHEMDFVQAEHPLFKLREDTLDPLESVFLAIFTVEIVIRLWVRHLKFFKQAWNCMDFVLVSLGYVNLAFSNLEVDFTLFRVLRLVRLTRILRVIRVMQSFRALRVLLSVVVTSMFSLAWSVVLIGLILLMSSCFMTAFLLKTVRDPKVDYDLRAEIWRTWGTFGHSFNTLLKWTLTATWPPDADLLILGVNPLLGLVVYPFIIIVNFALTRVVTAVFIKETFAASQKDAETVLAETSRKDSTAVQDVRQLLVDYDQDGRGALTREEFKEALEDRRLQNALAKLDVHANEAGGLFTLLDNGRGLLSYDELIAGAMNLRGDAKAVDAATIMYENQKIMLVVRSIEDLCSMLVKCSLYNLMEIDDVRQSQHEKLLEMLPDRLKDKGSMPYPLRGGNDYDFHAVASTAACSAAI